MGGGRDPRVCVGDMAGMVVGLSSTPICRRRHSSGLQACDARDGGSVFRYGHHSTWRCPAMTGARVRCGGAVLMLLSTAFLAHPSLVWADDAEPARPRVELALKSWLFTNGETKWSHNASGLDPQLGDPTSKLTYKDNNSHILELSGKFNVDKRLFVRIEGGFSVDFDRGTLTDDDYSAVGGQHLFSRTTSDITGHGTWYVNGDVGVRLMNYPGNRGYLDFFGGYQYWRTKYEASGITQVVCAPSGIPGIACNPAGTDRKSTRL